MNRIKATLTAWMRSLPRASEVTGERLSRLHPNYRRRGTGNTHEKRAVMVQ